MNTYIQDKLDEFDKQLEKIESFSFDEDKQIKEYLKSKDNLLFTEFEYPESQFELNEEKIRNFIEQSLTDYHNHILEKIVKDVDMTDQQLQDILSILQDTNPKE